MGSPNLIPVGVSLSDLRRAVQKLASLRLNADSTPTFASQTITGLTANRLIASNASQVLVSSDLYSWVTQTANRVLIADDGDGTITFSTPQDIHTGASPTFANLILGTGELTAGSINRAADTLTLEIAGAPELSISTDLVAIANSFSVDTDVLVVDAVADTVNGVVFFGDASGNFVFGNSTTLDALTSGSDNFAIGGNALSSITTQSSNVAIGDQALKFCTAFNNLAIGALAGQNNTTGSQSIYIGTRAGRFNQTKWNNVVIGYEALAGNFGLSNIEENVAIGTSIASGVRTGFDRNVNIGYLSASSGTTMADCVFIGYKSGFNQTTNSNILIIDNQDRGSAAAEITDALIYGIFNATPANQSLRINGEILGFFGAKLGDGTNETQISTTGDLSFHGTAGLIFGHMDIPDAAVITIDTSATDNPVEVKDDGTVSVDDGWETGELNGTVFAVSNLHYITITIPGKYKVLWGMSIKTTAGAGTKIHAGITIDSTTFVRDNGEGHAHVFNVNDDINVCSMGVIDCPNGNEEISLWAANDQNQKTVIEHGNMYIQLIAGT